MPTARVDGDVGHRPPEPHELTVLAGADGYGCFCLDGTLHLLRLEVGVRGRQAMDDPLQQSVLAHDISHYGTVSQADTRVTSDPAATLVSVESVESVESVDRLDVGGNGQWQQVT